jgi:hypothetical protein
MEVGEVWFSVFVAATEEKKCEIGIESGVNKGN